MIRALCHAAIAALFACALAGCGQKGPLKIPEPAPGKPAPATPASPNLPGGDAPIKP
jgi:predicted small lipoprotein YifL